jgi:predicted Zn-dependent protease
MRSRKEQLEQMLAADPKDAFLRYALAMEYVAGGDLSDAVQQLERLLADSPDYVAAYQQCGQLLIKLNRLDEAKTVLQRGMSAARQAGDAHAMEEMQGLVVGMGG